MTEKPKAAGAAAEVAAEVAPKSKPTEFVVLRLEAPDTPEDQRVFVELDRASATTDVKAIEAVRATLPEDKQAASFVAVPVRSWRVRTPGVKVTTRTVWS